MSIELLDTSEHNQRPGVQALLDIARIVQEQLQAEGIAADQARKIGLQAADEVRRTYGGTEVYISKGLALVLSERDWQIWREFDGGNHHDLARKYDTTPRHIYRIVARCREEDFLQRQGDLFG